MKTTLITQHQNKNIQNNEELWKSIYTKDIVVFHNINNTIDEVNDTLIFPFHSIIWIDVKYIISQHSILKQYPDILEFYQNSLENISSHGNILGCLLYINHQNKISCHFYYERGGCQSYNTEILTDEEQLNLLIFFRFVVLVFNQYEDIITTDFNPNEVILNHNTKLLLLTPPKELYQNIMFYQFLENNELITTLLTSGLMNKLNQKPLGVRHIMNEDFYLNDYPFVSKNNNIPSINQNCLIYKDQFLVGTDCLLNINIQDQLVRANEIEPLIVSGLLINDKYILSFKENFYTYSPIILTYIQDTINKQQEAFFKLSTTQKNSTSFFINTLLYEVNTYLSTYYKDFLDFSFSPYALTKNFMNAYNLPEDISEDNENNWVKVANRLLYGMPNNGLHAIKAFVDEKNLFLLMINNKTEGLAFVTIEKESLEMENIVYNFVKNMKNKKDTYNNLPLYKIDTNFSKLNICDIWQLVENNEVSLFEEPEKIQKDAEILKNGIDFIKYIKNFTITSIKIGIDIVNDSQKTKHQKTIALEKIPNIQDKGVASWKFLEAPLPLIYIKSSTNVEDIYNQLITEFPYFKEPSAFVAQRIALCQKFNNPFHFPPILLNGSPGIGKTRWAKRIAQLCDTNYSFHSLSGIQSSMGIIGSERGWSEARPGFWAFAIKKTQTANPIVVLDEIDKSSIESRNGSPQNSLLPFFEKETASKYKDLFLMTDVDISLISYVLTSNDTFNISEPLQSRLELFQCRTPTQQEIDMIFNNILKDICCELDIPDTNYCNNIDFDSIRLEYSTHNSIRILRKKIEKEIMNTIYNIPDITDKNYNFSNKKIGFVT